MFRAHVVIIRSKLHYTASSIITPMGVMQFWPPDDDEHMCPKHVEAWNKLIVKQKFCASGWLITEINIHYRVSQGPVTCPYPQPEQSNPRPHFLNIRFNFIFPYTHRSSKRSLCLGFPHQNALCTYPPHTCCMPCPGHLILIDLITRVIFGAENRSRSSLISSFLHSASPVSSSHLGSHIFLSTLLCSSSICTCSVLKVISLYETFDTNSFYMLACLFYNTCY